MQRSILILGGTAEARALAGKLAGDPRFAVELSLAGRTRA
ncbi:cobalt-precorrin-6A reductase, partial [Neorhizobium sp. SHOUNA12A]|nr:cobalt-precorrin-6A reductase [Neorhizobium sp. SHOUNA12A]